MLVANRSFAKSITAGKQYEFVRNYKDNIVIIDDNGFEVGYKKEFFEPIQKQTAMQLHIEWLKATIEIAEEQTPILVNALKLCMNDAIKRMEVEKEQIIKSYNKGREAGVGDYIDIEWGRNATELTAEQYYNETFGKKVINCNKNEWKNA